MKAARDRCRAELERAAALRGYPAEGERLERLLAFVEAVLERGRSVNLTGARDLDEAVRVLAWTALAVVPAWGRRAPPRHAIDLGTGNGLPGVAVALAWPDCHVRLIERRKKKARAVAECVRAVRLPNAEVLALDGRELLPQFPELASTVDLVTVRAVGSLAETTGIVAPWVSPGGLVMHWKGERLEESEESEGLDAARALGLTRCPPLAYADEFGPARLVRYMRPGASVPGEE